MSKLFKLKEWLTVPDAARHLAITFGEEVKEADVLKLALDGKLQLSVNIVNGTIARTGSLIPIESAPFTEAKAIVGEGTVRLYGGPVLYSGGIEAHVFKLDAGFPTVRGICDLPMIGGEKLDVEHRFQSLIGGPAITSQSIDGSFVKAPSGVLCQLLEDHDDNEHVRGSRAHLEKIRELIAAKKLSGTQAADKMDEHREDREKFLAERKQNPASRYYPAGGLPEDTVFVVRTDALTEFVQSVSEESSDQKPLSTREKNILLTIIAVLCKEAKIDHTKASKAAGVIEGIAAQMGVQIGESTIEGHLKKIPDALERRTR